MTLRRTELKGEILELVLDRPGRRNALDGALTAALVEALAHIGDQTRVVLIRGDGPAFCAGYDVRALDASDSATLAQSAEDQLVPSCPPVPRAIEACAVPVVAALHGAVFGGGLELALACDLRVAAPGTRLGVPAAQLGLVYSRAGLRQFVAAFGPSLTRDMLLTGRIIDRAETVRLGVARDGDPLKVAAEIARYPPLAQRGNRQILRNLDDQAHADAIRSEALRSDALLEAVRAFQGKSGRRPVNPLAASHAAAISSSRRSPANRPTS